MKIRPLILTAALAVPLAVTACGSSSGSADSRSGDDLPQGSDVVTLDPADFTTRITNPYWPMRPGSRWVFREVEDGETKTVVTRVTSRTRVLANGVRVRVVHDRETADGELAEDTFDFYAQDRRGNIWYMGEDTKEYEDGKVKTTKGSWEAGRGGAQAGIAMPAGPRVGMRYRQEYFKGEAEDAAEILSLNEWAQVPAGKYRRVLMTKDHNPLEPDILEHKFYARGVGPVLALGISGGSAREELVRFTHG